MKILVASLALVLISTPSSAQAIIVKQDATPKCSTAQKRNWDLVTKDTLGVIGRDVHQNALGSVPANRIFRRNWWPLQDIKIPMCGTLHHFNWFSGDIIFSQGEEDWNNFLIPSPAFQQTFQDAFPADKSKVWKCGEEYCMEAEITPNAQFYENKWWSKKKKEAQLTGKQLCAYGPFVEEEWHGKRPEIHPSELYWWKDDASRSYWMLLQEDSSSRFDKKSNYANTNHAPAAWQPWAQAPRAAEFRLAFLLKASNQSETYSIAERSSFQAQAVAAAEPKDHSLKFGNSTLDVTEAGVTNEHIKVDFVDLCLTDNNELQGYVGIKAAVGLENSPQSGGQELLEVAPTEVSEVEPLIQRSYVTLEAGTPRLTGPHGQEREIGDLTLSTSESSTPTTESIAKIIMIGPHKDSSRPRSLTSGQTGMIEGVDVISGVVLEIEMQSGTKTQVQIPPLGLALSVTRQTETTPGTKGSGSEAEALVRAIGGRFRSDLALETLQHHDVLVDMGIHYAPVEAGQISAEDSSPFSEKLNDILIKNDVEQIRKTLGSVYPFKAEWNFEGWEYFSDGHSKEFPVVSNGPATNEHIGTHWHSQSMNPRLVIEFPPGRGRLFRVVAIGTYTDRSGATGKIRNEIWNQEILSSATNIDELLNAAAVVGNLTDTQKKVLIDSKSTHLDTLDYLADSGVRRADLLRLQAQRASQTGRVSIEDFQELVWKIKALAPPEP